MTSNRAAPNSSRREFLERVVLFSAGFGLGLTSCKTVEEAPLAIGNTQPPTEELAIRTHS
jgi:hypothetical protein